MNKGFFAIIALAVLGGFGYAYHRKTKEDRPRA